MSDRAIGRRLRVLIVEDDDSRMDIFDKVFASDEVTRAPDALTGIDWIRSAEFDLVALDHDLGPGGDGQDVARAICALPERSLPFVLVHSWNPDGSRHIGEILADGGVRFIRRMFGANLGDYVYGIRRALEREA